MTYVADHSNPELVASATGYVSSTPSSRHTGINANPKKPKQHNENAISTGSSSKLNTWKK